MSDLEAARIRWLAERESFELFGKAIAERMRSAILDVGIWADVGSRAKEVDSLIRKLINKPNHSYDSLGDKAGVRVIVRYKNEIDRIVSVASEIFVCGSQENKADSMEPSRVGYLSTHLDVRLRGVDPDSSHFPGDDFRAELQIRTLAQHLWSEMAHDSFYKNDDTLQSLPNRMKRRIYLLAGVVEVADDEFTRVNHEMPYSPEIELLKYLEGHYYKLTTRRPNSQVSLDLISRLLPLYGSDIPQVKRILDEFVANRETVLKAVYEEAETDTDRSAFLYQPEAIMVYERLEHDPLSIQTAWNKALPQKELERLANQFGISLD